MQPPSPQVPDVADRPLNADVVRRVLADPPLVHDIDGEASVWSTGADVYELMASRCPPGTRVLETGCGISTLVFVLCGARLTTVAYFPSEEERFRGHCASRDIALDNVEFHVGSSHDVLPGLPRDELDLVFVDGGHGYPTPIVDALYAGRRLRRGGLLVLDDVNLPAVEVAARVLDADPSWQRVGGDRKWGGWTRVGDIEPFSTDHYQQAWLGSTLSGSLSGALERSYPATARRVVPLVRAIKRLRRRR